MLALRRKKNIKVRQPLTAIMIPVADDKQRADIEAVSDLITSEVNVKGIKFVASDEGILVKKVKPDFKKLGPKYGKIMKALAAQLTTLPQADIHTLEQEGSIKLMVDGQEAVVDVADVEIISEDIPGWLVANEGNLTVALDITITDELRREGVARELVNRIQNVRKSSGFEITDKINVVIASDERTNQAIDEYHDYIAGQVQALSLTVGEVPADAIALDMDGWSLNIKVEKAC